MPLGTEVGLGPDDIVLDGYPAHPPKKVAEPPSPIFGSCLLWRNGWMDQDGTWHEVGLGPGHIVLDGDPAPDPKKGAQPPIFRLFLLWPNGWMHQDATWCGGCYSPGDFVLDGDPTFLPKRGRATNFWPTSFVVKRLHRSRCHLVWR